MPSLLCFLKCPTYSNLLMRWQCATPRIVPWGLLWSGATPHGEAGWQRQPHRAMRFRRPAEMGGPCLTWGNFILVKRKLSIFFMGKIRETYGDLGWRNNTKPPPVVAMLLVNMINREIWGLPVFRQTHTFSCRIWADIFQQADVPWLGRSWQFPEIGAPLVIIHLIGISHYKPSIFGYPQWRAGNPHDELADEVFTAWTFERPGVFCLMCVFSVV